MSFSDGSRKQTIYLWIQKALNGALLVLLWVYLIYRSKGHTNFKVTFPQNFPVLLALLTLLLMLAKLILSFSDIHWVLPVVCFSRLVLLIYQRNEYEFLLFLALLVPACLLIDYHSLLKTYLCSSGLVLAATILAALCDNITNLVSVDNGTIRGSMGTLNSPDFVSWIFYLILALWTAFPSISDECVLVLTAGCYLVARYYCNSLTVMVCALLLMAVLIIRIVSRKRGDAVEQSTRAQRIIDMVLTFSFPGAAAVMFLAVWLYSKGLAWAIWLNDTSSDRLRYALEALQTYGIRGLGTLIDMVGYGGSTYQPAPGSYNFVDSSYPHILLRYGWILLTVCAVMWCVTAHRAIQRKDRRLAVVLAIVALHCISEHHFLQLTYNIFFLVPVASIPQATVAKHAYSSGKRQWLLQGAGSLLAVALLIKGVPVAISWLRTVMQFRTETGALSKADYYWFYLALTAVLALIIYVLGSWYGRIVRKRKIGRPFIVLSVLAGFMLVGGVVKCNDWIRAAQATHQHILEADTDAVEIIQKSARGLVLSDVLPEAYVRQFGGMDRSVLAGDDLARISCATLIVERDFESECMLEKGYLYAEISEYHSIYSNDTAVTEAMSNAGYHVMGYYPLQGEVDLGVSARRNALEQSETGGLLIHDAESMSEGPYIHLRSGRYTVTYSLKLADTDGMQDTVQAEEDEVVCRLGITAYKGSGTLKEYDVYRSRFDENGEADIAVIFTINTSVRNVEFTAMAQNGQLLEISGVHYEKTPEYDTHDTRDALGRVVRSVYYTLDGESAVTNSWYSICEYEYDDAGNLSAVRYYNQDGNPLQIREGYAQLQRSYDSDGHITEERYYNEEGAPATSSSGYAILRCSYDETGRMVSERYYSADDEATLNTSGFACRMIEYNEAGRASIYRYLDLEGNPAETASGYAEVHREYDEKGRVYEESYYGADGLMITLPGGYSKVQRTYNVDGTMRTETYLDANGQPVRNTSGYMTLQREYDAENRIIRENYYDVLSNGQKIAVKNNSGYAAVRRAYNNQGRMERESYLDEAGQPVQRVGGYAAVARSYTQKGWAEEESYYGENGEAVVREGGYACVSRTYTNEGLVEEEAYYGLEGVPALRYGGYAKVLKTYDENGWVTTETYYGVSGNEIMCIANYASVSYERNELGQIVKLTYYDTSGNITLRSDGYAIALRTYTENGLVDTEAYCDAEGNPVFRSGGYSMLRFMYDADGKVQTQTYCDAEGQSVMCSSGYASLRREYTEDGRVSIEQYYDLNHEPVSNASGYAQLSRIYSSTGYVIEERYYDGEGSLTIRTDGYAVVKREYTTAGYVCDEKYYDITGGLTMKNGGYAEVRRTFTDGGLVLTEAYYDADGNMVQRDDGGYASIKYSYDEEGHKLLATYYDAQGQVLRSE